MNSRRLIALPRGKRQGIVAAKTIALEEAIDVRFVPIADIRRLRDTTSRIGVASEGGSPR